MARAYGSCAQAKLVARHPKDGFFSVLTLHRDDLRDFVSEEEIAPLSDDDMRLIASKLGDALLSHAYWVSLQAICEECGFTRPAA